MKLFNASFFIIFSIVVYLHYGTCDGFQRTLGHIKPKTSKETQTAAVKKLIQRIIPDRAEEFDVKVIANFGPPQKDTYKVEKVDDIIKITGNTGVAVAWGFHYYLKYYCKAHISWEASQLKCPEILPEVNETISSNDRFRYYQNVCTTSYSFSWWQWKDWEKHIDWMAMNGFNLVLAFNGQEAIWERVYKKFGLTDEEINEHFAGPAFFAWNRMGNFRGWGGPLSQNWHQQSLVLQKRILKRMRELGIIPILPGFAGHVPRAMKRLFGEAKLTAMERWCDFVDEYCCPYLLDPTDDLFNTIGVTFMQEQILEFGTDHVYNCDTFNEMLPSSGDLEYLRNISKGIFAAMTKADPKAIWILQGWFLYNAQGFWTSDRANAFITAVPTGKLIVLDLQSEQFPQFTRLESYFGQPFIWNMLHNFGGNLGMFGSANRINKEVFDGRNFENSTMIGSGLTPEGINQNYVIYDLMMEMFWRKQSVDIDQWFEAYATRRYGKPNVNATEAWKLLSSTVYDYNGNDNMRGKYIISRTPRLNLPSQIWYSVEDFMKAWNYLLNAANDLSTNAGYRHDLVDVTRQALQIIGDIRYDELVHAFKKKRIEEFQALHSMYITLFKDLNTILASNEAFLLGKWLESAKALATTSEERRQYEFNARNQISLWGPKGEIKDYANKQWAGVVSHLFGPRWGLFLNAMNESLVTEEPFNEKNVTDRVFLEVEDPFTKDTTVFPITATGDSIEIAKDIHKRWRDKAKRKLRNKYRVPRSSEEDTVPKVIGV